MQEGNPPPPYIPTVNGGDEDLAASFGGYKLGQLIFEGEKQ